MKLINLSTIAVQTLTLGFIMALSACSNDPDDPMEEMPPVAVAKSFTLEVVNLTNNQPMSPVALVSHETGTMWQLNQMASIALETMAESGDNAGLLIEDYVDMGVSGEGTLVPGAVQQVVVETFLENTLYLSLATMLVNTNDAFTGLSQLDVTNMQVGDSLSRVLGSYDAGTEANSESMGTIPGPADGGEGFNGVRDDVDFISRHAGVVSLDDGLSLSVLNESHRFDNPVARISITRTQ